MANFLKYQHIERLGTESTMGILENPKVIITPKIDGTNASIWIDDEGNIACGSRNRQLSAEKDNAGFYAWVHSDNAEAVAIREFLYENPIYRIFGEFTGSTKFIGAIKDYNPDALGQLWIFDVMINNPNGEDRYENSAVWKAMFSNCPDIFDYCIPALSILEYPSLEDVIEVAKNNTFLLNNANHAGEGVVIRASGWKNKYGKVQYAKFVLDEYKQNQKASKKKSTIEDIEQWIIENFLTDAEIAKAKAKCELHFNEDFDRTNNKHISFIMNCTWTESILEEIKNILKKAKNPTINFEKLRQMQQKQVREYIGL